MSGDKLFFCVWFTGWVAGLATFAGVFFNLGDQHVNIDDSEARGGKIATFCDSVAAWESRHREELAAHSFFLSGPNFATIPCAFSESSPNAHESSVGDMADGECQDYPLRSITCGPLGRLIPDPVEQEEFELTLRSERALLSQRVAMPAAVGSVRLKVAFTKVEPFAATTSKTCSKGCAVEKARTRCHDIGGRPEETSDGIDCHMLHVVAAPCYVITCGSGGCTAADDATPWSMDGGLWPRGIGLHMSEAFCLNPAPPDPHVPGYDTLEPDPAYTSTSELHGLLMHRSVTFRSANDPYVIASELSDSTFDFGWSKEASIALGVFFIILGICFSACSLACLCVCCIMALAGD
mmetsp:Transcript_90633/g.255916  ORF Transcript_90633/g.255916 Transcript_90633/m.255916 type:complete len:351 (-) Transcript_90633:154-1206(-)